MMKRCISALLLLTLLLTLCACAEKEKTLAVSVGELSDKVADAMASEQTAEYDETMLLDELGIQSSMFTEGFYKIGASDASVEEVAFFKAADEASALQLKQKLETAKAATRGDAEGLQRRPTTRWQPPPRWKPRACTSIW